MNWTEFFAMGGRGFYVWGAFGVFAAAIALEVVLLRVRARRTAQVNQTAQAGGRPAS
jgi:heme exporter protein D